LTLLLASTSFAAGPITISAAGNNTYIVNGSSMDGVAGIEIQITYAVASLGTPKASDVTAGSLVSGVSGAIFAANPNSPGTIRIAIISTSPFSGSGPIAKIVFPAGGGTAPPPQLVNYSMIDSKGAALTSQTHTGSTAPDPNISGPGTFGQTATTSTPSTSGTSTGTTGTTTTSTATSSTGSTPTYLGTVTMPQDFASKPDVKPPAAKEEQPVWDQPGRSPAEQPQIADRSASGKKEHETETETEQYLVYKGVIERFKQYKGETSLAKLSELFKREVSTSIHQEPSPLLSDGKTTVTLTVDLPARITAAPNFAMNGAKLLSHKQEPAIKGRWILTALPDSMTSEAALTILAGSEGFEYPLTVAPPLRAALKLDETGWKMFQNNRGTDTQPLYDLDQDGVRDYRDDFIFVTNYLVQQTLLPAPTATKPATPSTTPAPAVAPTKPADPASPAKPSAPATTQKK